MKIYKILFQDLKNKKFITMLNEDKAKHEQNLKVIKQAEQDKKGLIVFSGLTQDDSDLDNYFKLKKEEPKLKTDYSYSDLECWGERELRTHIIELQNEVNKK